MADISEEEILARIRTMLALERNYLAEERTTLAEFRTGLALVVIAPPASTAVAYIISLLQAETENLLLFKILNFAFLVVLTALGVRISLQSRSKLKRIREKRRALRDQEVEIVRSSKAVYDLVGNSLDPEDM